MTHRVKLIVIATSACLVLFLMVGSVLGRDEAPNDVYRHFNVFTEVLWRIKSEYVEEPDMKDVTLGALNGLLESIDPYASYLNADQLRQYERSQKTDTAGVGLALSRKVGYVSVIDAIPGSPADKAGLTTGDMIETIGGVATRDMPLAYAEMLFRGKPGSSVDFTVLRVRQTAEPQQFHLTRVAVADPPVRSEMLPGDIGLLRVQSLESGKSKEVARHLKTLTDQGAKKIILDLRRCATGAAEEGAALADLFIDNGLLTYSEGQKSARHEFRASSETTVSRLPLVVLTNRGTADGAEVAAAAIQDDKRGEVVGERTYGDAGIRDTVQLQDGGAVILSVAKYYSPSGKALQDEGVTPTVVAVAEEPLPLVEGEEPRIEFVPEPAPADDQPLQKAIEVLTQGAGSVARDNERAQPRDPQLPTMPPNHIQQ
jgi:carboxyl-terminal processing protease